MKAMSRVRVSAFVLALASATAMTPAPASAQEAAAFVNGSPITTYDVDQRIRINKAGGGKASDRKSVLRDLIDDQLKILEARRIGYRLSETNIDDQVTKIANSNRQTLYEFSQYLAKFGIDSNAYRKKLLADYSWELAVEHTRKAKLGSTPAPDPIFGSKTGEGVKVIDYALTSVVFIVPPGTAAGQRQRDAAAARARFSGCASGLDELRALRDVALRPPIRRASNTLNKQLAALLAKTPVDKLTPPMASEQGIEMIAVCEKTERIDRSVKSDAEKEATAKQNAAFADDYMKTLRSRAVIQYR